MVRSERPDQFAEAIKVGRRCSGEAIILDSAVDRLQPIDTRFPRPGARLPRPRTLEPPADTVAIIELLGRSATQSGRARENVWRLRFVPRTRPSHDPLTGWIGGDDPLAQIELRFPTRDAAVRYAERQGLFYEVRESSPRSARPQTKQAFQLEPPLALCCWPTGPHALCCGRYPPSAGGTNV